MLGKCLSCGKEIKVRHVSTCDPVGFDEFKDICDDMGKEPGEEGYNENADANELYQTDETYLEVLTCCDAQKLDEETIDYLKSNEQEVRLNIDGTIL